MKIFWLWKTIFKSRENIVKDIEKNRELIPYLLFYIINSIVLLLLFLVLLKERSRILPVVEVDVSELNYFTTFIILFCGLIIFLFLTGLFQWLAIKIVKGKMSYAMVLKTYVFTTLSIFIGIAVMLVGNLINTYAYLITSYWNIALSFIAYLLLALGISFIFYSMYMIYYFFSFFAKIRTASMIIISFFVFFLYIILFFIFTIIITFLFATPSLV